MKYLEFRDWLKDFTVFSLNDIKIIDHNFYRSRLNEWQEKGYIKKIVKGYYIFSDLELSEQILYKIANKIYSPSYISFEMALSYYNLIPESVYSVTSASTRRTYTFQTSIAVFTYRTIKPNLFFGYDLSSFKNGFFKIASIEKAILDYFYINPHIKNEYDFESLRINKENLLNQAREEKLYEFLEKFQKKSLEKRIKLFWEFMKNV